MTADQDTFAKMLIQALSEWWAGAGAVAWAVLGVLLLVGVVVSSTILCWIILTKPADALQLDGMNDGHK